MKRFIGFGLFGLSAVVLFGCPIWSDDHARHVCTTGTATNVVLYDDDCVACYGNYDCPAGYECSNRACTPSGGTVAPPSQACSKPDDCAAGSNCGTDLRCHAGDCSNSGCPTGYLCKLSGGTLSCVANDGSPDGGGFDGCTSDAACAATTPGARCLDGACVAPADQCSDATQCPNNEQCVQGGCTPSCDATHPCPTGYGCDTAKGVCTGNPTPCGASGTCSGATTCVDEHCVTKCGPGNTCANGLICVDGGCIPDQKPQFVCAVEGKQDACASGSLCLHHSCYIACAVDAGATACKSADKYNTCKQVQTASGTYSVCGSSSNLGSQCDPTQGKNCATGQVCIDGFCR